VFRIKDKFMPELAACDMRGFHNHYATEEMFEKCIHFKHYQFIELKDNELGIEIKDFRETGGLFPSNTMTPTTHSTEPYSHSHTNPDII